jgi:hypothetical protein
MKKVNNRPVHAALGLNSNLPDVVLQPINTKYVTLAIIYKRGSSDNI